MARDLLKNNEWIKTHHDTTTSKSKNLYEHVCKYSLNIAMVVYFLGETHTLLYSISVMLKYLIKLAKREDKSRKEI